MPFSLSEFRLFELSLTGLVAMVSFVTSFFFEFPSCDVVEELVDSMLNPHVDE